MTRPRVQRRGRSLFLSQLVHAPKKGSHSLSGFILICTLLGLAGPSFAFAGDHAVPTLDALPIPSVFIPGVDEADAYARQLIAAVQREGRPVAKIVIYWVSPDSHPNPQLEAVIRLVHLAFGVDEQGRSRQVIEAFRLAPDDYNAVVAAEASKVEEGFLRQLRFVREELANGPAELAREILPTSPAEDQSKIHELLQSAKVRLLHAADVPNGIAFKKFFRMRSSRNKRLIAGASAAVQIALTSWVGYHGLHATLGNRVYAMLAVASLWTGFFAYFQEQTLAWKSQGVAYYTDRTPRIRQIAGQNVEVLGGHVGTSRSFLMGSGFVGNSMPMRLSIAVAGNGLAALAFEKILRTTETSLKGTFTKLVWEQKITELRGREIQKDRELAQQGKRRRRPDWLAPSFLWNTGFNIFNSVVALLDQFSIGPAMRIGFLAVGLTGLIREVFWMERERTLASLHRMGRTLQGRNPNDQCHAALLVEYQ